MTESSETQEVSESQIAVHWREEEYYPPPDDFVGQANANDPAIFDRFTEDKFPTASPSTRICSPGTSAGTRCSTPATRHSGNGSAAASSTRATTVSTGTRKPTRIRPRSSGCPSSKTTRPSSSATANCCAGSTSSPPCSGISPGLRPATGSRCTCRWCPRPIITMLACARLGVIHSQVFGGFSGNACGTRIADSGSRVLITMDGYYRAGAMADHKVKADEAMAEADRQDQEVDKVLVWRRKAGEYQSHTPMVDGRDFFVDEVIGKYEGQDVAPVSAGRGAAVPDVHQRHHRPARRARSTAPAATCPTWPGRRSTTRTSTLTTCTGAWPTSAGSPATPTSSTGRCRSARRRSSTRASRTIPTPAGPGGSPRSWA